MPNLNDFLSRIQTDHAFYLEFRRNPEEALAPYGLSAEERAALTESREQLRTRLGQPDSHWKLSCTYSLIGSGELDSALRLRSAGRKFKVRFVKSVRLARTPTGWHQS